MISLELLTHYQCEQCKEWWSVADGNFIKPANRCPHCGYTEDPAVLVREMKQALHGFIAAYEYINK